MSLKFATNGEGIRHVCVRQQPEGWTRLPPLYQCVGYPVAPMPGWFASMLPFSPCVGSITPPLLMALTPVQPALAGKWLQTRGETQHAGGLEEGAGDRHGTR